MLTFFTILLILALAGRATQLWFQRTYYESQADGRRTQLEQEREEGRKWKLKATVSDEIIAELKRELDQQKVARGLAESANEIACKEVQRLRGVLAHWQTVCQRYAESARRRRRAASTKKASGGRRNVSRKKVSKG